MNKVRCNCHGPSMTEGKVLSRVTREPAGGLGAVQFISPHGLAVDPRGDLCVGEVCYTACSSLFPNQEKPKRILSLQKYERVAA